MRSKLRSKLTALALALPALLSPAAITKPSFDIDRFCKPVFPQVIVALAGDQRIEDGVQMTVRYSEQGTIPYSAEEFGNNLRMGFCETKDGRCITGRSRYEARTERFRFQSLQLRLANGDGNPIIGGLRWRGPSYPDQVTITCDLDDPDIKTACVITDLGYTADPLTSGRDGQTPSEGMTRHDQCEP